LETIKRGDFKKLAEIKADLLDYDELRTTKGKYPLGEQALKTLGQQGNSSNK
jgi:hypothetical protein